MADVGASPERHDPTANGRGAEPRLDPGQGGSVGAPMLTRRDFAAMATLAGLLPGLIGTRAAAQEAAPATAAPPPEPLSFLVPTTGIAGSYLSIVDEARRLSHEAHRQPESRLGGLFEGLNYDSYRAIRPTPLPLGGVDSEMVLDVMPPGLVYTNPVRLSVISGDATYDVVFDPRIFSFDPAFFDAAVVTAALAAPPPDWLGYSGFRMRAPLNRPDKQDEFVVFQGASYFRAVARGLIYGISARGLAIDTAEPQGEEFPRFSWFWIEHPAPDAPEVTVRALLESPSCTGAFEFVITPGETTVMQTRCTLFPRRTIDRIGIAPLTSMYFFGPQRRVGVDDFRDAVHDSSGLQMITGDGRRLWRTLSNPLKLQVSAFADDNPKGYGLTQRQRTFDFFQDDEAHYERRPSCWVEPLGQWGRGAVILVEIPVNNEFHDNVVAFWRPEAALAPDDAGHEFRYRLHWCDLPPDTAPLARVMAARSGAAVNGAGQRTMVVDFAKEEPWAEGLTVRALGAGRDIGNVALRPLPKGEGMRASFNFAPGDSQLVEFEMTLVGPAGPESETWLFRWTPP